MIAVLFEAWVSESGAEEYLALASALRDELEHVEGFISVERFRSLVSPGKLLSLSFWHDEAAVERWRTQRHHRAAQAAGRSGVFIDYRLRVAAVIRDYGLDQRRDQAPADLRSAP
ncbi:MAG: antibiotic biosynthesis monooxygenase family protein [Candidatus Eiseniibacteriota bacterium]